MTSRVALVTGGTGGIGTAMVKRLARAGHRVATNYRNEEKAREWQAALKADGIDCLIVPGDVADFASSQAMIKEIEAQLGGVDILINNAGIARSETAAEDVADEHWLNVLDVNLNGSFWCARAFGRHMLAAGRGSIVNVGSMSGLIVNRPQPQCYYNASKAAVHQLTRSLAVEWAGRGVRVNAVAPTYIATPLNAFADKQGETYRRWIDGTPMARLGDPAEVAAVVLFLASDMASLMTGSVVLADGGYSCW